MILRITERESALLRQYIERHCGIHLEEGKEYLIETRLTDVIMESGLDSYQDLYDKVVRTGSQHLRDRIVDAMTTNETFWFRNDRTWDFIRRKVAPDLVKMVKSGQRPQVWCSAVSTGQEAYSLVMLLLEAAKAQGVDLQPGQIRILGTDISMTALFQAISARYDKFAVGRGLPEEYLERYFTPQGRVWALDDHLKKFVKFERFNLQEDFSRLGGPFDLILCRNVTIYFSDEFKRDLFKRMAKILKPERILFLGASESLRGYSDDFEIVECGDCVFNRRKA